MCDSDRLLMLCNEMLCNEQGHVDNVGIIQDKWSDNESLFIKVRARPSFVLLSLARSRSRTLAFSLALS